MKYKLLFILLIISNLCSAQWPKVFGQYSYDVIGRYLVESYDHGIYIAGAERLNPDSYFTAYVMKLDINGFLLWKRYIDDQSDNIVLGISQTTDGGIFISGQTQGISTEENGFYMKLDACGEKVWCAIIDIPSYSSCVNNIILPDGGFIIQGGVYETVHDRIWLYKVDSVGNLIWMKTMIPDTSYFNETGYYLINTNDSCVLVSGFAYTIRDPNTPQYGWQSPFWVKFDYNGDQIWDLPWFTTTHIEADYGNSRQDAAGNFYSAGSYGLGPGADACFYKFSNNGARIGYHILPGFGTAATCNSIEFFEDSTLFLGGAYAVNEIGYSMAIKSDTNGNIINSKNVPLYGGYLAYSTTTFDHKILAMGERPQLTGYPRWETCLFKFNQNLEYDSTYTMPMKYDSLCTGIILPDKTFNLDCQIVSISDAEKTNQNSALKIYPNPTINKLIIELPDYYIGENQSNHFKIITTVFQLVGEKKIEIVDLKGQIIYSMTLEAQEKVLSIDASNWSPGMYLARLVNNGKTWAQGKIIKTSNP
ncbi:MAG: T9SS type A sorting domain-containing protein [Bacteroidales bacterium]|nr:T9SS type A sorting domain-containing protein [Bacteroidales bacterium]